MGEGLESSEGKEQGRALSPGESQFCHLLAVCVLGQATSTF